MIPLSSQNSDSQNFAQVNSLMQDVQSSKVTQIFKDDTGTRRVLLGKGKDGFYGLKVSEPGVDVYEAAETDLIFNSSRNIMQVLTTGTTSITPANSGNPNYNVTAGGFTVDVTFTNPTGAIPSAICYFKSPVSSSSGTVQYVTTSWQAMPYVASTASVNFFSLYFELLNTTTIRFHVNVLNNTTFGVDPLFLFSYQVFLQTIT